MAEGKGGISAYVRLQIAYALEFAIWGCWSYALGTYANVVGVNVGKLYSAWLDLDYHDVHCWFDVHAVNSAFERNRIKAYSSQEKISVGLHFRHPGMDCR